MVKQTPGGIDFAEVVRMRKMWDARILVKLAADPVPLILANDLKAVRTGVVEDCLADIVDESVWFDGPNSAEQAIKGHLDEPSRRVGNVAD